MSSRVRMQNLLLIFPGRRFRRRKIRSPKPSRCRANLLTPFLRSDTETRRECGMDGKKLRARCARRKKQTAGTIRCEWYPEWKNRASKICRRRSNATSTAVPPVVRWSIIATSTPIVLHHAHVLHPNRFDFARSRPDERADSLAKFFPTENRGAAFSLMLTA